MERQLRWRPAWFLDVSHAGNDAERRSIAGQYAAAVAAMHKIPVAAFVQR
jgi:hypothetical protein